VPYIDDFPIIASQGNKAINDGDSSSEKGSHDESIPKEKVPLKKRRVFEKGFPCIPFAILTSLLLLGIGIAVCIV
jgi:hypothetical protein